jgi:hypothetical protein
MKIWIDCEFNDYQGELISMALVDENDREWYVSLGCVNPSPWVYMNVMPFINLSPTHKQMMQKSLAEWLQRYSSIHVIADYPTDIEHFCNLLITGPGTRIDTPKLTMEIDRNIDSIKSAVPHNALSDARALKKCWENLYK